MESCVPKELQAWEKVENLIFDATQESLEEAYKCIFPTKKNVFPIEFVVRLVVRASIFRPFSMKVLSEFLKSLGKYTKYVGFSPFTEYCIKKGILLKSNIYTKRYTLSDKTPEEIEKVLPDESLFTKVQNGSVDDFRRAACFSSMWEAETELINNKVNLLDVACYFGKIEIIKFLILNGFELNEIARNFVVAGGNEEAIKFVDSIESLCDCLKVAIITHQKAAIKFIVDKYGLPTSIPIQYCIEAMNTYAFSLYYKDLKTFNDTNFTNELTPVLAAVAYGQVYLLEKLMIKGAKLEGRDKDGRTAILLAPHSFCDEMLTFLINRKLDFEARDRFGQTALLNAVSCGNYDAVKTLVKYKANIEAKDMNGNTSYMLALLMGHLEIAKYLESNGAKTDLLDKSGRTPIEIAINSRNIEVVKYLLDKGVDIDMETNAHATLLHEAVSCGSLDIVKLLLQSGMSINSLAKNGFTPIYWAASLGKLDIFQYLYEKGANTEPNQLNRNTLISAATVNGRLDIVKYILNTEEIDINKQESDGSTVIHKAAGTGQIEVLRYFLDGSGNVNVKDRNNNTPINYAVMKGKYEAVKVLIEYKANLGIKNKDMQLPIIIAAMENKPDIVKLLVENGSVVDIKDVVGMTPYLYAARNKNESLSKYLADHGALVSARNTSGINAERLMNRDKDPQNQLVPRKFYNDRNAQNDPKKE